MFMNDESTFEDAKVNSSSQSVPNPERGITQVGNSYKSGIARKARLVGRNLFNCDICGKDFSRKEYLQIHHKKHLPEKPFMCKICGREFDRNFPLKRHKKIHENAEKQKGKCKAKRFECEICLEKLANKSSLLAHYSSQHPADSKAKRVKDTSLCLPCRTCGKIFKTKASVKRHMLIHKNKPFHCDICRRNYVSDSQLQEHKAKHFGKLTVNGNNKV